MSEPYALRPHGFINSKQCMLWARRPKYNTLMLQYYTHHCCYSSCSGKQRFLYFFVIMHWEIKKRRKANGENM